MKLFVEEYYLMTSLRKNELLKDMMIQIEKDFNLAGYPIILSKTLSPEGLVDAVTQHMSYLFNTKFNALTQILYRIDVPEYLIQSNVINPSIDSSSYLTELILRREWLKVKFRNKN